MKIRRCDRKDCHNEQPINEIERSISEIGFIAVSAGMVSVEFCSWLCLALYAGSKLDPEHQQRIDALIERHRR